VISLRFARRPSIANGPEHRIWQPRRRGGVLRERWRADMSEQRTRGQVLKETAAARDPVNLGQQHLVARQRHDCDIG
jgi:hypothetical protein